MYVPQRFTRTPHARLREQRRVYPLYRIGSYSDAGRLTYGIRRRGGRGLFGTRTVLSKGAWAARTRFHVRASAPGALYALAFVAGFLPRVRNFAHSAIIKTALGGYALVAATQYLTLFSFARVAPDSPLYAAAVWAQQSWWWPLSLLRPHTVIAQVPSVPRGGASYARAGGSACLFVWGGLWGSWAFVLLPSGQPKFLQGATHVALGPTHPALAYRGAVVLAGDARRFGTSPRVRGTAKNANDHPNGGRTRALRLSQTPWAKPAKKSRKPRAAVKLRPLSKRSPRASRAPAPDLVAP